MEAVEAERELVETDDMWGGKAIAEAFGCFGVASPEDGPEAGDPEGTGELGGPGEPEAEGAGDEEEPAVGDTAADGSGEGAGAPRGQDAGAPDDEPHEAPSPQTGRWCGTFGVESPPDVRDLPAASTISTQELGRRGEDAAVRYLEYKGYAIMERNWRCRFGEVDIIAADEEGVICFIEVKTRRSVDAGLPEEAITLEKQRRYEKIALCYMIEADWDDGVEIRFDAIGICVNDEYSALLRYHRGCFDALR